MALSINLPSHRTEATAPSPAHLPEQMAGFQLAALDEMEDAVVAADPQHRVIYLNRAAERQYGVSAEQATGRPVSEVYSWRWLRPDDEALAQRELEVRGAWRGEIVHLTRDGRELSIRATVSVLRDQSGAWAGLLGILVDLTGRNLAQEKEQTFLRAMLDAHPNPVFVKDESGRFVFVNQALAQVYGTTPEALVGRLNREVIPSAVDYEAFARVDREVLRTLQPMTIREPRRRPDGSIIWYLTHKMPIRLPDGRMGVVGTSADISEHHEVEEQLRHAQARTEFLAQAMDDSSQPFVAGYPDGRLTIFNRAFTELTGYAEEELGVMSWACDLTPPEWREYEAGILEQLHHTGKPQRYQKQYRRKDGSLVPVEVTVHLVRKASGEPDYYYAFVTDISQRQAIEQTLRAAREAAEEASRAKDHFLAVLSHELRTPMTPVLMCITELMGEAQLPENLRDDLAMIRRNVDLEVQLIDDLLDTTRITRGKLALQISQVDLCQVLRYAAETCMAEARGKGLELSIVTGEQPLVVRGDGTRLQQVFWNLIKNAVKFTSRGGVRVRCVANQQQAVIVVEDDGIGMDPEVIARIFAPFEQGGAGTTRKFGGLGLGLTISRALVEMHGGTIAAASEGKGKGSTLTVTLPLSAAVAATPAAPPAGTVAARTACVLLVEDHQDTARALARLLRRLGHQVHAAGDIASALPLARAQRPDMVISDIGLPDGTGLELMRQLAAEHPHLRGRAIALSGYGTDSDRAASRDAGFAAHLTKPVAPARLQETILRLLSESPAARS